MQAEAPAKISDKGGPPPEEEADPKISFAADDPRPLYVYRKLINAADLLDWAREKGFTSTLPADDLHVTVTYSKTPVNWFAMSQYGSGAGELVLGPGGPRLLERLCSAVDGR
ncbi:hypothetical protein BH10PSE13_BH10PSE13_23730 [soil metagenome]